MSLAGKHVCILAENEYEDLELWYPLLRLKEEGARVTIAGPGRQTYNSKHGYPVKTDLAINEAKTSDFDAVVIPGGSAPDRMRRHPPMVDFVREMNSQKKIIAAICHAGSMLVSANVLRGKNVTGFFSIKDDLVNAGGRYEDREVIRDGNLITSRTPQDLPAFCRSIVEALSSVAVS